MKHPPDDIIFNVGSDSEVFYILKSGRLIIETIIEIEDYYKFPIVRLSIKPHHFTRETNLGRS